MGKQELTEAIIAINDTLAEMNGKFDKMDKKFDAMDQKFDKKFEFLDGKMEEQKKEIIGEMQQRMENQSNVIIYGINEHGDDKVEVKKIIEKLEENAKDDIKFFHRLGKAQKDKTRPIKVAFFCTTSAQKVLRKSNMLKDSTIYIKEDLTKKQMDDVKEMQKKIREKNETEKELLSKNGEKWILINRKNPSMRKITIKKN